jgi:ABC-type glycerol-3-phosphate transport system permease component
MNVEFNGFERCLDELSERLARLVPLRDRPRTDFSSEPYLRDIIERMGLINTYPALLIAYLTFTIPVAVWFLRGFFAGIPLELEESAMIDGCTRGRAFFAVVLPLSLPGISATATYVFFVTWQELMFSLAFTTTRDMRTLSVGILDFIGEHVTDWGALMAASILVCLPVFALFIFMQNQFIAGLTEGAIKG